MKKQFFIAAAVLTLASTLTSCSRDYWDELSEHTEEQAAPKPTTFMTVAFTLPKLSTRAGATDGQDLDDPNFNHYGKWAGTDKIDNLSVYVFNGDNNTAKLEIKKDFASTDLLTKVEDNQLFVKVKEPFLVSKGNKKVYVVINSTTESNALLPAMVNSTTLEQFSEKYESAELSLVAATGGSVADKVAKLENNQHIILMTGAPITKDIEDGVSKFEASTGTRNNASVLFKRAVSRVLVTTTKDSYTLAGYNPSNAQKENDFLTLDHLHYVVAQGENHLYFQQKASTDGTAAFTTPAFDQVPQETDFDAAPYTQEYNEIGTHYDYAGLKKDQTGNTSTVKGFSVKVRSPFAPTPTTVEELAEADLNGELAGQYVLPTLHKFNTDETQTGYRKGNTPYVLVRARITPKKYIDDNGQVSDVALADDADLYYGLETGYFYVNKNHVTDGAHHGKANQKAYKYTKRVALYFAWLNPDNVSKPLNSPVVRNNIYHLHIASISQLGSNWNPLVPKDKDNPDPFPNDNPNEPTTPRVFPHDPLYKATPIPEPNPSTPGGGGNTPGGGGNTPGGGGNTPGGGGNTPGGGGNTPGGGGNTPGGGGTTPGGGGTTPGGGGNTPGGGGTTPGGGGTTPGGGGTTPGGGGDTPETPNVDETKPQPWMKIIVKVVKWRIHSTIAELNGL